MKKNKYRIIAQLINKGVPFLFLLCFIVYLWNFIFDVRIKLMFYNFRTPTTLLNVMYGDYPVDGMYLFLACILWVLIFISILFLCYVLFGFIQKMWFYVCKITKIVNTKQIAQVIYVQDKVIKKKDSTMFIDQDGILIPISSEYSEYFLVLKLGNKESILLNFEVGSFDYSRFEKRKEYKVIFENYEILGHSIDYELKLNTAIELK